MVSRGANGARMAGARMAGAPMAGAPMTGPAVGEPGGPVLLDCATCAVRGTGCSDCVVALLLGPPEPVAVDDGQVRALAVLAGSGLVPPLRHLPAGRPA